MRTQAYFEAFTVIHRLQTDLLTVSAQLKECKLDLAGGDFYLIQLKKFHLLHILNSILELFSEIYSV
jgi:hypothetical protein